VKQPAHELELLVRRGVEHVPQLAGRAKPRQAQGVLVQRDHAGQAAAPPVAKAEHPLEKGRVILAALDLIVRIERKRERISAGSYPLVRGHAREARHSSPAALTRPLAGQGIYRGGHVAGTLQLTQHLPLPRIDKGTKRGTRVLQVDLEALDPEREHDQIETPGLLAPVEQAQKLIPAYGRVPPRGASGRLPAAWEQPAVAPLLE